MFRLFSLVVATLLFALPSFAQPNAQAAVEQCRVDYPAAWAAAHKGGPDSDDFAILCARDLKTKVDDRFGLNGKRGNPADISDDIIAYRGVGTAFDVLRNEPMEIIDFCISCGAANANVGWNPGPGGPGDKGVWIDPFFVSPSRQPSTPSVPVPSAPPPAAPGADPHLAVLQSIESLLRAQVEAQQYTNARLAALEEYIATDPSPTTLAEIKNILNNMIAPGSWFEIFNLRLAELKTAVERKKLW